MLEIEKTLETLGLSPADRTVYLALLAGATKVAEIMKTTRQKRPTIYYSLGSLLDLGLVAKSGKQYGSKYTVEPLEKLELLAEMNIEKDKAVLKDVQHFSAQFSKKKTKKVSVSYYDTIQSVRDAIMFSVFNKEKMIRSIVPGNNFFHETGMDFVQEYVGEKNLRGIRTKAIWEDIPAKKVLADYYAGSAEIRQLPVFMHNEFETTIFIYDDTTLYIGPKKEGYAVLVESADHAKMMKMIFENVWHSSLPVSSKLLP